MRQIESDSRPEEFLRHIEWEIPSREEDATRYMIDFKKALLNLGWEPEEAGDMAIAFHEAVLNAVVHGNRYNPGTVVHVNADLSKDRVQVSVLDHGRGFKRDDVPDMIKPENIMSEHGRGIQAYMETAFDSVQYLPVENGFEVLMIKLKPKESG